MKIKKFLLVWFILILAGFTKTAFGQAVGYVHKPVDSAAKIKEYQNAINIYTQALKRKNQPKNSVTALHFLRGASEAAIKEFYKAIADYTTVISINPAFKDIYWNRGIVYQSLKNYQLAMNDFQRALTYIKDNPTSSAIVYNSISGMQRHLLQYDKAIESCSQAIILMPNFGGAYANRGELYALTGQYQLGINDISTGMNGYRDNKPLLSLLLSERADMKRRLKQYKDAINDFSYALELDPSNRTAYWNRAATYANNGDYELANQDYDKAISFYKGDNRSLSRLYDDRAHMEMGMQLYEKAIKDDSLAISVDNQFSLAYWNRANAYAQNGDYQLSVDWYNRTMSFYQNNDKPLAQLYDNIASEEYFLNDYQKVIDASTKAIALDTQSWNPYLNRGRAYLKKANKNLAINDFNKILLLDTTKKSFGYAFALFYTGNPDKAIEVMQNNLIATTDSYALMVHYYNTACLFSLMNKPDEANSYLKKCIEGGYPKRYALTDTDLDNIRNTQEYKDIINSKSPN